MTASPITLDQAFRVLAASGYSVVPPHHAAAARCVEEPKLPDGWHLDSRGDLTDGCWTIVLQSCQPYPHTTRETLHLELAPYARPQPIPWEVLRWVEWRLTRGK